MSEKSLTRREFACLAAAGTVSAVLTSALAAASEADQAGPSTTPVPTPMPTIPKPTEEGTLLTQAVPASVGYALTDTQAKEVKTQLASYPGTFAKVRAFAIPNDVAPAFAALPPARSERKGQAS